MTAREAVEFFASKIEQQAEVEHVSLTKGQKLLLRFSEVEPGAVKDPRVGEQFGSDDDDEFEETMGELLVHAFELDEQNPGMLATWMEAKEAIKGHDFYIKVMVWDVFPELMPKLKLGKPSTVLDYLIYIAVACAVVAVVFYIALRSR